MLEKQRSCLFDFIYLFIFLWICCFFLWESFVSTTPFNVWSKRTVNLNFSTPGVELRWLDKLMVRKVNGAESQSWWICYLMMGYWTARINASAMKRYGAAEDCMRRTIYSSSIVSFRLILRIKNRLLFRHEEFWIQESSKCQLDPKLCDNSGMKLK